MMSWINNDIKWADVIKNSEICTPAKSVRVRIPWCMGMLKADELCGKYKGKMPIITNSEMQRDIFSSMEFLENATDCSQGLYLWTGFSDKRSEGTFKDVNEMKTFDSIVEINPFVPSEPNGGTKENCVVAKRFVDFVTSWYDTTCSRPFTSSFCTMDEAAQIKLRGDCIMSELMSFVHC